MKCKSCNGRRKQAAVGMLDFDSLNFQNLAMAAVGALAAKMVEPQLQKIPVQAIQENPVLRDAIKLGAGVVLAAMENEYAQPIGVGMVAYSAANLISSFLPTAQADGARMSGIYGSGRYQVGSGPVNIAGASSYAGTSTFASLSGTGGYDDGMGTSPDAIISGYDDDMEFEI